MSKLIKITIPILIIGIIAIAVLTPNNLPKLESKEIINNKTIESYTDGSWKVYNENKKVYVCHVKDGSEDGENIFDSIENMEMFYNNFYK